jgi:hypothetical protein
VSSAPDRKADRKRLRILTVYQAVGVVLALSGLAGIIAALSGGIPAWCLVVSIPAFGFGIWRVQRSNEEEREISVGHSELERIPMPAALPPPMAVIWELNGRIPAFATPDRLVTIVHGIGWEEVEDSDGARSRPGAELAFVAGLSADWDAEVEVSFPWLPRWVSAPSKSGGDVADIIEATLRDTRTAGKVTVREGWLFAVGYGYGQGSETVRLAKTMELISLRLRSVPRDGSTERST